MQFDTLLFYSKYKLQLVAELFNQFVINFLSIYSLLCKILTLLTSPSTWFTNRHPMVNTIVIFPCSFITSSHDPYYKSLNFSLFFSQNLISNNLNFFQSEKVNYQALQYYNLPRTYILNLVLCKRGFEEQYSLESLQHKKGLLKYILLVKVNCPFRMILCEEYS